MWEWPVLSGSSTACSLQSCSGRNVNVLLLRFEHLVGRCWKVMSFREMWLASNILHIRVQDRRLPSVGRARGRGGEPHTPIRAAPCFRMPTPRCMCSYWVPGHGGLLSGAAVAADGLA